VVVIAAAQSEIVGGQKKKAKFRRLTIVCRKDRDAENGRDRHPSLSPSISAPADDDNHADPVIGEQHQVSAPGSGEACTGDQETGGPTSAPPEASPDLPLRKPSRGCRVTFVCGKGIDRENGRERARTEKADGRAGVVGASGCAAISNDDDSQLPSISAPADAVFGDGDLTDPAVGEHHQVSPSGSGNVCAGDQEASPSSSSESSVDLTPSPGIKAIEALEQPPVPADDTTTDGDQRSPLDGHLEVFLPAIDDVAQAGDQDSVPSSPNPSDDDEVSADNTGGGGIDLQRIGRRIAMEMDDNELRLEVERQFRADRQLRRVARRRSVAAAAPPARFSLKLTEEEALEDVAAVSLPVP
jgi:hypothetical protein